MMMVVVMLVASDDDDGDGGSATSLREYTDLGFQIPIGTEKLRCGCHLGSLQPSLRLSHFSEVKTVMSRGRLQQGHDVGYHLDHKNSVSDALLRLASSLRWRLPLKGFCTRSRDRFRVSCQRGGQADGLAGI